MRDNGNFREVFGLGAGAGVVRVTEWVRTEHQVRPHDSLAPGPIHAHEGDRWVSEAPPTMRLARPPEWAQRDDLPCTQLVPKGNAPDPFDTNDKSKARTLCAGCPVRRACLDAALAEEGTLRGRNRYLVRGGLTPRQRAKLSESTPTG